MTDPISTLVSVLQADAAVSALVGTRVFGGELDDATKALMPTEAVVVVPSGGASNLGGGYLPFNDGRFDVICYGTSPFDAYGVWDVVVPALTRMQKTGRVYWARLAGGPLSFRDPATDWPVARGSFQALANEP
jgi:hypothetical protein